MLAEVTTTGLSKNEKTKTFNENKQIAKHGGNIAKNARKEYEEQLDQSIISKANATDKILLEVNRNKMKINKHKNSQLLGLTDFYKF